MHIEAFVQARMGSTRLPGKVLKTILGKPLLEYLVDRLLESQELNDIVILTTTNPNDDAIESFCLQKGVSFFRGSEEDVLDRYYKAAVQRKPDAIVRITADCPMIDPEILDQVVRIFRDQYPKINYVSNTLEWTFPRGLDVTVVSFQALEKAFYEAHFPEEREHVTLYHYRHPEQFNLKNFASSVSLAHHRWTVDTIEDFTLIKLILEHLYPNQPHFRLVDILNLLKQYPEWSNINASVEQKIIPERNN